VLELADEILGSGVSVEQFVADLADYFRSLLLLKCGIEKRSLLSFSAQDVSTDLLDGFSVEQLEKAIELLLELYRKLRYSLHPRFDLELVMCQLASLQDLILPAELLAELRALKGEVEGDEEVVYEPEATLSARETQSAPGSSTGEVEDSAEDAAEQPTAQAVDQAESARRESGADPLGELADALRKDRLALASALAKAESCEIVEHELRLHFQDRDRFPGEQVQKEKELVLRRAREVFPDAAVSRVSVVYARSGSSSGGAQATANQIDIVKKIFRGEIVQGE
jgi:DNA polymerase III gamma/tau subunit